MSFRDDFCKSFDPFFIPHHKDKVEFPYQRWGREIDEKKNYIKNKIKKELQKKKKKGERRPFELGETDVC